jgi:ABC-type methionine transport system permease subunit
MLGAMSAVAGVVAIGTGVGGLATHYGYAHASVNLLIFGLVLIVVGVGLYRWSQRRLRDG